MTARQADRKRQHPASAPNSSGRRLRRAPAWKWFVRLTEIGFPRRFPIVQFPNAPLIVALVADQIAQAVHGVTHAYVVSIAYLAMTVWAYEELARGVNWFRRLLGVAFAIILIVRVARAVHT